MLLPGVPFLFVKGSEVRRFGGGGGCHNGSYTCKAIFQLACNDSRLDGDGVFSSTTCFS